MLNGEILHMEDNDLREAFTLFDVNRDGRITETELESVLGFLGVKTTREEVRRMIRDADCDVFVVVGIVEFSSCLAGQVLNHSYYSCSLSVDSEHPLYQQLQPCVSSGKTRSLYRRLYARNGTVEFDEFLRMMRRYSQNQRSKSPDDELRDAFNVFDQNGDSVIDFGEIKRTMHFLGEAVTDDEVREMIKEADLDQDGLVDFEDSI
ncbi:unnamed protein product [Trichobilharzia szidati]|nr:unnamed protein product [Trichobilharzia szidati]